MARDNFIGWSIDEKITFLRALQEVRLTGPVTRTMTARGVETEFNLTPADARHNLQSLEESIAYDTSTSTLDPAGTVRAGCQRNLRVTQTHPIFW